TPAFHAGDRGSNPLGDATFKIYVIPYVLAVCEGPILVSGLFVFDAMGLNTKREYKKDRLQTMVYIKTLTRQCDLRQEQSSLRY
ncbi:MAG: hypothetical protein KQI81_24345, partial [Deltaproteobacteria bacterium]|nr:hypothetical protein [Deltaproteobacteria bacterium]